MAGFKPILVAGDITLPQLAEIVNRVQQLVNQAFAAAEPTIAVRQVASSAGTSNATVQPGDRYLIVNSNGGPLTISLPTPSGTKQEVTLISISSGANVVTVKRADGQPLGTGEASKTLESLSSMDLLNTGKEWLTS